jgi:hypothetical protein
MLDKVVHYHPRKSSQIQKKLPGWQPFAILFIFIILAKQTVFVCEAYIEKITFKFFLKDALLNLSKSYGHFY